jgi:hypothetical protein
MFDSCSSVIKWKEIVPLKPKKKSHDQFVRWTRGDETSHFQSMLWNSDRWSAFFKQHAHQPYVVTRTITH